LHRLANGRQWRVDELEQRRVGTPDAFDVEALVAEELGADAYIYASLLGDTAGQLNADTITARIPPHSVPRKGEKVGLRIAPGRLHAFDPISGGVLPTA